MTTTHALLVIAGFLLLALMLGVVLGLLAVLACATLRMVWQALRRLVRPRRWVDVPMERLP
jgi:Na+-transporting methylmalonyl-CoA/oxaloacetate decarboxylase gamma subunit